MRLFSGCFGLVAAIVVFALVIAFAALSFGFGLIDFILHSIFWWI